MTPSTVPAEVTVAGRPRPTIVRPRDRTAASLATAAAVAKRTFLQFVRTPQLVVVNTVQGAMFLLIFRYVFGGAISSGPVPYVDFLVPGFVVTGVLFSGMSAAAGAAEDLELGFFDRLRSLPVHRPALLAGRALADTGLVAWGLLVTVAVGFLVGFRLHGEVVSGLAAFGLCIVFGFAFTWMFITVGLLSGNAQAAQGISMFVFPLAFVSSAYVPVDTMPGWMQLFAEHQPITAMVHAVRSLCLGDPALAGLPHSTAYYVAVSLLWSAGLIALFAPMAVARYRRG